MYKSPALFVFVFLTLVTLIHSAYAAPDVFQVNILRPGLVPAAQTAAEPGGTDQIHARQSIGSAVDPTFNPMIGGGPYAIYSVAAQADGMVLLGGKFNRLNGVNVTGLVRVTSTGETDTLFNAGGAGPNGAVHVIVLLGDGKILIGGTFTQYNGTTVNRIARLNADGTLDTSFATGTAANNTIQEIVVQPDGKFLISGSFTSFDGTGRNRVARLSSTGDLDISFNPNPNAFVEEVVLQADGKIIIGGGFTTVGGVSRRGVARLNSDGSLDTSFVVGTGFDLSELLAASVYAAEIQDDGKIVLGGDFLSFNGVPVAKLARLNSDGSLDMSYGSPYEGYVVEFLKKQPDGKMLAAGHFGSSNYGLLRLNADGSEDASFVKPTVDDLGYVIALDGSGNILLGGLFTTLSSSGRTGVVRLGPDGTLSSFAPVFGADPTVRVINHQSDGKLLVGGEFRTVHGVPRRNLARFNPDGTLDQSFDPGDTVGGFGSPYVSSVQPQPNGRILVGGSFSWEYGNRDNYVKRLMPNGTLDTAFAVYEAVLPVSDIAVLQTGAIILSGYFVNQPFNYYSGIELVGPDGGFILPNSSGASNTVYDIEPLPNGKFLIGGAFTLYGGASANRIAKINPDLSRDSTFNPGSGANAPVNRIRAISNGKIYVAGTFSSFNAAANTNDLVRLNADGLVDSTFSSGNSGFNGSIYDIAPAPDGKLYAGGSFSTFNGTTVPRLVRINDNGSLDPGFDSQINDSGAFVNTLLQDPEGRLLAGGSFVNPEKSLVRYSGVSIRPTLFDYDGDGRSDFSVRRPSNDTWYLLRGTAGFTAQQFGVAGDRMVPADYDGDGKTDVAMFRPSNGTWYVYMSQSQTFQAFGWGQEGDLPVPTDRDNDGKTDLVIFRPSNNTWYTRFSNATFNTFQFGAAGDKPVVGDFDGDGEGDVALFRPSNNNWYIIKSSLGFFVQTWGEAGDQPLTGDFDGDGSTDQAVFRQSTGQWFLSRTSAGFASQTWGQAGDVPVPADYDGDGKADVAVWRPADGKWYIVNSRDGILIQQFGQNGDVPTQSSFNY